MAMKGAPNFNRLARLYRWMEFFSFGPLLALTRGTFVNRLRDRRKALVLGDGDGRFTARLLRANAEVHVDAVDGSGAMLAALLSRAGQNARRVSTQIADIRAWSPLGPDPGSEEPYDLIATHFFLDCLTAEEVESVAGQTRRRAAPGALWVVSEFAVPSGWFGLLIARPIVAGLYHAFGMLTGLTVRALPDYARALRGTGFRLLERRLRLSGLLVAELWGLSEVGAAKR
jgi:Methyltransferase domain